MIQLQNNEVFSTDNRLIHRIGTDTYFRRGTTLPTDTADCFEEVDCIPPYTKSEYDAKVAELVRERYSDSEEFAIQRKYLNSLSAADEQAQAEYAAYNSYVDECKQRAKDAELYDKDHGVD